MWNLKVWTAFTPRIPIQNTDKFTGPEPSVCRVPSGEPVSAVSAVGGAEAAELARVKAELEQGKREREELLLRCEQERAGKLSAEREAKSAREKEERARGMLANGEVVEDHIGMLEEQTRLEEELDTASDFAERMLGNRNNHPHAPHNPYGAWGYRMCA
jgi:hypothetical protein